MKQKQQARRGWPWLGGVMVLAISALTGYWHAQQAIGPEPVHYEEIELVQATEDRLEKIEHALAQAGCPGWMALASEGPTALSQAAIPPEIRTVSAEVPRVRYPQPLRVATRVAIGPQSVVSQPYAADDPDDLLDGTPDLLLNDAPSTDAPPADSR